MVMPLYKYLCNRILTKFQNLCFRKHLSEYHTGYRAYKRNVLMSIKYHDFSNDFIFDNQIIIEAFSKGYKIQEIYCPARYDNLSSSIKILRLSKIWMSSSVLYNKANIKRKVKNGSVLSMYCFNNIFIHSAHS